ncbi:MAG: hypothetical protein WAL04_06840 [Acidimicrobiales bacterium]|jgi:hypothetical protein
MADLTSWEVERLRRSVAMLPSESPQGLSRERALGVLEQLRRLLEEREHRERPGREAP